MGRSGGTLQWQDANAKVFQLAEGADEVQLILDSLRTVCDQLETGPGKELKKKHTHTQGNVVSNSRLYGDSDATENVDFQLHKLCYNNEELIN